MTDWLLHTLVATSGLILLVLVVREPVRRLFGSRTTYGLWLIPAARLFMPTITRTVGSSAPSEPPLHLLADQPLAMAHVAARVPSVFDALGGWPAVATIVWLGVAAGLFFSRMIAFCSDRRAILRSSSSRLTRLGSVRLVRTGEIASPVALGILSPIIAVPADFSRMYARRERRLVLEHELAHHRSGDLVVNLFAFVLLCLQWFNPLAWVAHAAFRFDQEAACDARVLDKAPAADRASYGRAIAKAASGRALLFASALNRPTSLQRRLQSMVRIPSPTRRTAGRLLILVATAVALPLTAGHAIAYADAPIRAAPRAASARVVPAAAVVAATVVEPPAAPIAAVRRAADAAAETSGKSAFDGDMVINDDFVTVDGTRKRWEDLTPAELARVRAAVAKARSSLANTHIDQAKLQRDLANLPDKARIGQLQRELSDAQVKASEKIRRLNQERAEGRDADGLDAAIAERLASLRNVDFQAVSRSLAAIDSRKVAADVAGAAESIERAKLDLDRIQARIDADPRK